MGDSRTRRRRQRKKIQRLLQQGEVNPVDAGGALFNAGYKLDLEGKHGNAEASYRQTIEILEALSEQQNSNMKVSDLAELAYRHGTKMFQLGRYDSARIAFQRCREVLDSLIVLDAGYTVIVRLADTLGWLARTQRKSGHGVESCRTYERAVALWRTLLCFPQSTDDRERMTHRLATALFGLSKVLSAHGQKQKARRHSDEARELLQQYFPQS